MPTTPKKPGAKTPPPTFKPPSKKALSFDDPNYGKPAPLDKAYDAATKKIAKQQTAYDVGAAARANAKAAKVGVKKTPAKGGPGYIGIGGKNS